LAQVVVVLVVLGMIVLLEIQVIQGVFIPEVPQTFILLH
jgi:hypothetical protein